MPHILLSDSSFTLSCRVVELAARLGPCLPLSPIYIQGLSTKTETYITANQLQTLLRVNHPREHTAFYFTESNTPQALPPLPISATLRHLTSLQRQTHPTNTATQQHSHSSTAAQQHGTVPIRRISPVTQSTRTSDIDTRTTCHPVPPRPYHTPHNTNTHV